eukprot:gene12539-6360_t
MGRRSYLKRLNRTLSGIKNKFVRLGLSMEKGINVWAAETAGPELQKELASKMNDKVGPIELSKEAQSEAMKHIIALIPHQITQFKGEYSRFKQKISNPGSLLVGDLKGWFSLLVIGFFAFYIGMSIGRWHMFGFRYENEELE